MRAAVCVALPVSEGATSTPPMGAARQRTRLSWACGGAISFALSLLLGACVFPVYVYQLHVALDASAHETRWAGASVQSEAAPPAVWPPKSGGCGAYQFHSAAPRRLHWLGGGGVKRPIGSGRPAAAGCGRARECVLDGWGAWAALCARSGGSRRAPGRESDQGGISAARIVGVTAAGVGGGGYH